MNRLTIGFASVLLATAGLDATAPAQETRTVSYGELDLSKPAGRAVLMTRLRAAARVVCGEEPRRLDYRLHQMHDACVEDAIGRALASLPVRAAAGAHEVREVQAR